ncbi:solute carrier family 22 member 11-like [Molossus molossus]|uniref:Solute carrier family 22 member 11 n=1 Tax=Molossus molossus TaxID=27622 RepID=A0A7J8EVB5_MOLMO|nr:solute carrier family 22 member 11-like [Molossus molossus]KAF6439029.1 solute carrier family 22 member 11 [Molossus molossus]
MAFTELLERAGGMGLFQTLQVITLLLPTVCIPAQMLLDNFSAATPGHRCRAHMLDNGSEALTNLTAQALLVISIPLGPNHEPHQCRRFRQPQWQLLEPNATATNWSEAATEPCRDGWVYDRSTFTSTVVAEWGLVCNNQGLKPMGQAVFLVGNLLGSCAWGLLSYWIGRKSMLSWCCLQVAVANTSTIFAPNFLVFCGLRFLSAFGLAGIILTSTTLLVEWTMTHRRALTMTVLGCTYCAGQMVLGGVAFALRDWRDLHLAVSTPFFAIFLISWWLPESARWLIITGKPDQALQELKKVARINGHKEAKKTLTLEVLMSSMEEEVASAKSHQSQLDLFRQPILRRRSWCMLIVSFSHMMSYFGLILDLQNLGSDIYLLQVLFGAVDFLARATSNFLLRFFGRRVVLASSQAMGGLSILANVLVPQDLQALRVVFAVLGKGCFGITLNCFSVYKSELFPTSLRMTADGFLLSVGRLGAVMGPLIMMTRQALPLLPPICFGVTPIVSSLVLLFLPETQGLPLPDTIQDLENQRSGAARGSQREVIITESTWF